jgi:hypothetical protein
MRNMDDRNFLDSENQSTTAFERRHPSDIDVHQEAEILKTVERGGLAMEYVIAQISMNQFFAAGYPRPEHGDESY